MQACTKSEMQSRELLRSEVVSSFSWVGMAFAMASSTAEASSGSDAMVSAVSQWSGTVILERGAV